MDVPNSPLAAAFITVSQATLPVPWWLLAIAAVIFVCLVAKIVALLDERRRFKSEILLLEGEEEKSENPAPDTEMGGAED